MTHRLLPLLAIAATVPGASRDPAAPPAPPAWPPSVGIRVAQLSIHERIVIRIPRMRRPPTFSPLAPPGEPPPPRWIEKRGGRCVQADEIAGALVSGGGSVDLVMDDGGRTRALLEADCPALDYYLGFYIRPTGDGKVCAGRDAIRSRSGAACPIRAFRRLVPGR